MILFNKTKEANVLAPITSEQASEIYDGLKTKDANTLFLEDNIPTEYTLQVKAEIDRLESEYISKVAGTYVVTEAVPATYDDEGEIATEAVPAVYFDGSTKTKVLASMSSDLLNLETVASDIEDYYGTYEENRDFADFKALVTNQ